MFSIPSLQKQNNPLSSNIAKHIIFFIGKLHMHLVGFEPTTSLCIPLLWKEEVPFELELIGTFFFLIKKKKKFTP